MANFWRCFYHIVWTTKYRTPIITAQIEPILFEAFRQKCHELECEIYALNCVADHIHIALSIPPKLAVADWVKLIKGVSSRAVNTHFTTLEQRFGWQRGYGVLTFVTKNLNFVVN
jgi:putative transposase